MPWWNGWRKRGKLEGCPCVFVPSVLRNALSWKVIWLGVDPVRHASFACSGAAWDMSACRFRQEIGGPVADLPGMHDHAGVGDAPTAPTRAACPAFPQVTVHVGCSSLWLGAPPLQNGPHPAAHTRRICYAKSEFRRKQEQARKPRRSIPFHCTDAGTPPDGVAGYPSRIARARAYFSRRRASCSSEMSGQPA